ncbi:MAG: YHS domain-containing protein [Syntrophothermus sp.]
MSKDPICGMMVDEKSAAGKSDYQGKTYYFCSAHCKAEFDKNPARYAGGAAVTSHGGHGGHGGHGHHCC